jgi:pyruvate,orthophosphate dikinase
VHNKVANVGPAVLKEGQVITIDGSNGAVYFGEVPTVEVEFSKDMATLLSWGDEIATLGVRANADTPRDAQRARDWGAQGIGLCRTERMFNQMDRLQFIQEMILADSKAARVAALEKLRPFQKADFKGIFEAMAGLPVTVRLLDPPMHEFLPTVAQLELEIAHLRHFREAIASLEEMPETLKLLSPRLHHKYESSLTKLLGGLGEFRESHLEDELIEKKTEVLKKVKAMAEVNPMLGHRGVRLAVTYPEIYEMQVRAVIEAAAECVRDGVEVLPEVMVPQVVTAEELKRIGELVARIHAEVEAAHGVKVPLKFGSMIEVVRACVRAARLAETAEFFSFGTNDLTQATFSFSREDAENKFLPLYYEAGLLRDNPFEVLDVKGVGELMKLAIAKGRSQRPELKVGICGEHGGEPSSIRFCHHAGLNYVSCSGPRVPIARLAAAHAKLREAELREE